MEVKQIIDDALWEYYSEKGLEVPQWRMRRNPDWWTQYLIDLGLDPQNPQCYNTDTNNIVMDYRPYSPEWHRRRYLKEALDKYFDDYVDNSILYADIVDIISERAERAHKEFSRLNELEYMINERK